MARYNTKYMLEGKQAEEYIKRKMDDFDKRENDEYDREGRRIENQEAHPESSRRYSMKAYEMTERRKKQTGSDSIKPDGRRNYRPADIQFGTERHLRKQEKKNKSKNESTIMEIKII